MEIIQAVHSLISAPRPSGDASRQAIVDELNGTNYATFVSQSPQGDGTDLSVTIEAQAGEDYLSVKQQTCRRSLIEYTIWGRDSFNRAIVQKAFELGENLTAYLQGWNGMIDDLHIVDCQSAGPPVQRDIQPRDASDTWTTQIVYFLNFTHSVVRAPKE